MIWTLIIIYNLLYIFIYCWAMCFLGGMTFSIKGLIGYWFMSPLIIYIFIKDFSIAIWFLGGRWFNHFKYKFINRHTKRVYDPWLKKIITVKK